MDAGRVLWSGWIILEMIVFNRRTLRALLAHIGMADLRRKFPKAAEERPRFTATLNFDSVTQTAIVGGPCGHFPYRTDTQRENTCSAIVKDTGGSCRIVPASSLDLATYWL